jgi:3-oxoadipate enol-lactonase
MSAAGLLVETAAPPISPGPDSNALYGEEHVIRRAGYVVNCWDGGVPAGTPLVFTHGVTMDHRLFAPQVRRFAPQYRLVTWDAPGHGLSQPMPHPFTIGEVAEDLVAVLDDLGLPDAILVGVLMGGLIAQEVLFRHPERVRALVVIDMSPVTTALSAASRLQAGAFRAGLRFLGYERVWGMALRQMACRPATRAYMDAASTALTRSASQEAMLGIMACFHGEPGYRVARPTLLLAGEHDGFMGIPALMRAWAGRDPGCRFEVVNDAGHVSSLDQPEQVNERIAHFIDAVTGLERHAMMDSLGGSHR